MEEFLQSCSAALKGSSQDGSAGIHVVLGSESCDLDSMVSSLAYAYFLFRTSPRPHGTPVAVMNIPRAEFPLRSDSILLLREVGVSPDSLVFRDQLDLARLHGDKRLTLTLVHHNVLPRADRDLEAAVVEVIDHHHLERTPSTSCRVAVETVASCATLVTERIQLRAPELLEPPLALLLYGAILLDCVNMAPAAGQVTARDSQAACYLETRFLDLPPRGALFQSLQSARADLSGLSTEQILMKDMKKISGEDLNLAISTVYMTLDMFLQRRSLQQELCEFCHKHRLGALVAMTISFREGSSEPCRQLAVYSASTLYREEVSQALEHAHSLSLSLSPVSSPYKDVKAYHQGNTLASRKKLLPFLRNFLREWDRRQVHYGEVGEDLDDNFDQSLSPVMDGEPRPRVYSTSRHHRRRLQGAEDCGTEEELGVPPTPVNSLAEGCPLDGGLGRLNHDAILERFSQLGRGDEEEQS
ncbi:exopolyphosphatase PRUNE1-like isoform X1 [Osmerus eperlanus]|uniref:exopolyphosphatase PRUNE1-like isoform X1 n=2 Tax=Osmerus eperlanus TaxID=29151 RepID=UPI002E0D444F